MLLREKKSAFSFHPIGYAGNDFFAFLRNVLFALITIVTVVAKPVKSSNPHPNFLSGKETNSSPISLSPPPPPPFTRRRLAGAPPPSFLFTTCHTYNGNRRGKHIAAPRPWIRQISTNLKKQKKNIFNIKKSHFTKKLFKGKLYVPTLLLSQRPITRCEATKQARPSFNAPSLTSSSSVFPPPPSRSNASQGPV